MADFHSILRRRSTIAQITRSVALLLLIGAVYNLTYATIIAMGSGGVRALFVYFNDGFSRFGMGLGMLIAGIPVALFNRPLVKWLVPADLLECPKCSYELRENRAGRCPECGYELSHEAVASNS